MLLAKSLRMLLSLGFVLSVLSACSPAATPPPTPMPPTATSTPAPPTATPVPTFTAAPTPIPYGLTAMVIDAGGNPIEGAVLRLAVAGKSQGDLVKTDVAGKASWADLPGETISLDAESQGYLPNQVTQTIKRGANQVSIALKRDPFGLLPSQACAQGETLLYVEDFQDGKAQGWQNVTAATDFAAQNGWAITSTQQGNLSLSFTQVKESGDNLKDTTFDNAVWRLKVKAVGSDGFSFLNWRHKPSPEGETRYPIQWGDGQVFVDLTRLQQPSVGHFSVGRSNLNMAQNRWYYLEISTYQGLTQLWVDGRKLIAYQDPQPLPGGAIGLEVHMFKDAKAVYYFDDFAVCQLSAPFKSLPAPTPPK